MKVILTKLQSRPRLSNRSLLERVLDRAADLSGLAGQFEDRPDADVHVVLLDAESMAQLNEGFLGHSGPTDVLAFDLAKDSLTLPGERTMVGEIYLCADVAAEAADEYGTTLGEECVLYAVHGMLHLRGMDDGDEASRQAMRGEEERVMARLREFYDLRAIFACSCDESPDSGRADR